MNKVIDVKESIRDICNDKLVGTETIPGIETIPEL